jgi:hypothetical protein
LHSSPVTTHHRVVTTKTGEVNLRRRGDEAEQGRVNIGSKYIRGVDGGGPPTQCLDRA